MVHKMKFAFWKGKANFGKTEGLVFVLINIHRMLPSPPKQVQQTGELVLVQSHVHILPLVKYWYMFMDAQVQVCRIHLSYCKVHHKIRKIWRMQ